MQVRRSGDEPIASDDARERALREREDFLELALDASRAGTWSWDVATNESRWDARYHELYGFAPDDAASYEGWLARVHPDERETLRARVEALLVPGAESVWDEEFRVLHPVKGVRWMAGIGKVDRDAAGRALRFRGINLDVTDRRRDEEILRKNLERSEELAHVGHWSWQRAGNRLVWSPEVYRVFGLDPAGTPGIEALARAVHPDDRERLARFGSALLQGGMPDEAVECRIVAPDGTTRHILGTITSCVRDDDGTIAQLAGIMHDVTGRKSAEAEVLRIGEEERQRIAADLHDGVLQELAGVAYLAAAVRSELDQEGHALAARLRRIEGVIIQAIDHTRQVARAMDPMLPGGNGLVGALRHFAVAMQDTYRTRCTVESAPAGVRIDDPVVANQVYRIAQEAVRNAVRHGRATHVQVRLTDDADGVSLSVTDDGCGMPTGAATGSGMGVEVMRYRAGLIGGQLAIERRSEGGTRVRCRFRPRTTGNIR